MKPEFLIQGRWVPANKGEMKGRSASFLKQDALCSRWQVPPDFLEKKKSELSPTLFGAERKYSLPVIQTIEGDILASGRA
jgi:hypothetical protein